MEASGSGGARGNSNSGGVENAEAMPGRLSVNEQGAMAPQDLKKDRSNAQEGETHQQAPPVQSNSMPHMNGAIHNGPNGVLPNGVPAHSERPRTTNGDSRAMTAPGAGPDNPPPLDQSWRDYASNKSLAKLLERTAGQCYFDLEHTLRAMSEVPTEPQQQQVNGIVPHTGQDTSEGSLKRKRMLMDFASGQRDRFIKALVLFDWCRNDQEKSRLIDVKVWQDKQSFAHRDCTQAVANTKINMIPAKMPNPNIEGAMEVLATGKGSSFPDLGYIPPKRLTAKQLLKTLRNMNVILATRLNLHEELPAHFQDFSIADGRATFTVRDEFEVDLSVADEDPATPFYFIDIRLLFSPTSNMLDDRSRPQLEGTVNHELATKGLKGCYDFLHSFVLTHKLNVLKSQAAELIRGKWFDCIRVESVRRSLVVQYWVGMTGPKNWIEIGVSSGKQKGARSRRPPAPRMAVRWFRRSVEVQDEFLEFDWRDLDLQRCLSIMIAKHSAWIMSDLRRRIISLAPEDAPFEATLSMPESAADYGALSLHLPSLRQPLRVRIEPVTGQFSISPPSQATASTEKRLNSNPSGDSAPWLAGLVCAVAQDRVRKEAELLTWSPVTLVKQDNLQKVFGEVLRQLIVFSPGRAWGESWAIAISFSLGGEKWWAVSLEDRRNEQGQVVGKVITRAHHVRLQEEAEGDATVSHATLMRAKDEAEAKVVIGTNSKQLEEMQITHEVHQSISTDSSEQALERKTPSAALFIRFSSLMKGSQKTGWKPWANEMVRLTYHGIQNIGDGSGKVRHDLRLSLEPGRMKELQKHVSRSKDLNLAINSTGGLALRFLTPFGEPFVQQMQQRLHSIDRLDRYLTILKTLNYTCTHVSLSRIAFTYNTAPELSADLIFSNDGGLPARLKLCPPDSNPHQRVRVMLEKGINDGGDAGFGTLASILAVTLPVMRTFERLESKDPAKRVIAIHPRTSIWFSVKYRSPLPDCSFQLRARTKHDGKKKSIQWLMSDLKATAADGNLPQDVDKAVKDLWKENGEHWDGLGNGIVASAQGIAAALEKLDGVIRRFEGFAGGPPIKSEAVDEKPAPEALKTEASALNQAASQKQALKPSNNAPAVAIKKEKEEPILIVDD